MKTVTDGRGRGGGRWLVWAAAAGLLLVPAVAMRFTREVDWTAGDFVFFGVILLVACGLYELAARRSGERAYRAAAGLATLTGFLLVWAHAAVGFIGDGDDPLNLLVAGVLVTAAAGAVAVRGRPAGMARVIAATAAAQGLLSVAALVADRAALVPSLVFVGLWSAAAALFRRAAREEVA